MDTQESKKQSNSHPRCPACDGNKEVFDEEECAFVECTLCEGTGHYNAEEQRKLFEKEIDNQTNKDKQ